MLSDDIITASNAPWAAPVVLIPKKTGGIRVCIDFRAINAITQADTYPLPRIDDLLNEAKATNFMTTLDLQSGYQDQDKTTFITPFGKQELNKEI